MSWNEDVIEKFTKKALPLITEIPFQVQIQYTKPEKGTFVKIITMKREVTDDRIKAETKTNSAVIALQVIHEAASIAQIGK
jgi:hypothetical protein